MDITREERQELNALSKEVFGASGRWMKILQKGKLEPATRVIVETVPGENGQPDTTKEVTVAAVNEHGQKYSTIKRYTLEEVRQLLLDLKKHRDEALAKMKDRQDLQKLEKEVQELAGNNGV